MTASVKDVISKIYNCTIFDTEMYFVGGTALAYYLNHRISEDIDIISEKSLNHNSIISEISNIGGVKIKDENSMALRIAGLFPDEYIIGLF